MSTRAISDPFAAAFAAAAQATQPMQAAEEASPPPAPPIESTLTNDIFTRIFREAAALATEEAPVQTALFEVPSSQQSDEDSLLQDISNLRRDLEKTSALYKQTKRDNKHLSRLLLASHHRQADMQVEIQALKHGRSVGQQQRFNDKENESKSSWTRAMR